MIRLLDPFDEPLAARPPRSLAAARALGRQALLAAADSYAVYRGWEPPSGHQRVNFERLGEALGESLHRRKVRWTLRELFAGFPMPPEPGPGGGLPLAA